MQLIDTTLHATLTRLATISADKGDDTDYAKFATFEKPTGINSYPSRVSDPQDFYWDEPWSKANIETPHYTSETKEAATLLNSGIWKDYGLFSLELGNKLVLKSGSKSGPVTELFGVMRMYFGASYEALRQRCDYLESKSHHRMSASHSERVVDADCATYKMRPSGRKQRTALATKNMEAGTEFISQRRAASNMPGSAGNLPAMVTVVKPTRDTKM